MHIRYTELDKKHALVWTTVFKNGIIRKATNQSFKEHPSRKTILFLLQNKIIKILRGSTFTVEWQTYFFTVTPVTLNERKAVSHWTCGTKTKILNNYHIEKQFISLNCIFILYMLCCLIVNINMTAPEMSVYMYVNTHTHIHEGTYLTSTVSLRLSLTGVRPNIHFAQTSSIVHI